MLFVQAISLFCCQILKTGKAYRCSCSSYLVYVPNSICPSCRTNISIKILDLAAKVSSETSISSGGFVKELVTYMVTDNLELKPMSAANVVALFIKSSVTVKEMSELEVKVVYFGTEDVC
ncbi:hypothetical protein ACOSQ2_033021 [Xanthoceras sorbifolium]